MVDIRSAYNYNQQKDKSKGKFSHHSDHAIKSGSYLPKEQSRMLEEV
jgi:hypothetical protein